MYNFESALQRDGEPADERPDHVGEILNRPRLGYGEGDGIVDNYDAYPEQPDELTTPQYREFVTEIFSHPLVSSIDDAVDEVTPKSDRASLMRWVRAFENATELFDVEITDNGDAKRESRLTELVGDKFPDDIVEPSNPIVVGYLYAELGLSTDEIADVFSDSEGSTSVSQIRRVLGDSGLIEYESNDPTDRDDLRLGGSTVETKERGGNFNREAVEESSAVTIERE